MRAVRCTAHGPVDRLAELVRVEDLPEPVPGDGEVLVAVEAGAVNFTDGLFIADRYQVSVPVPFTVGSEFAGTVLALGPGVTGPVPGTAVAGWVMQGAFAERICVPATALRPVADGVAAEVAAATGLATSTAYSALRTGAEAVAGEWVAVTGAAGGVGSAAITFGPRLGLRTLAVVSTAAKAAFCAKLGADAVLDLSDPAVAADVKGAVRRATGGGVDVVLDVVGGDLAEQLLRALRPHGRFVTVGFASGVVPRIPLNLVLLKRIQIRGFEVREFPRYEPVEAARDAAELAGLLADGVAAEIGAAFPIEEAAAAIAAVAQREAVGKVVLLIGGGQGAT